MAESVVHLKRRVRNDETELFEWRKCACRLNEDGHLVLETVDDDEEDGRSGGETVDREKDADITGRVVVDLAWQLHALEQKRKCKTRCELQYVSAGASGSKEVGSEELMAPSPRHCEEWIELVREAEKRAKRRQSIRQGTATASAVAAMSTLAASTSASSSISSSGSHRDHQTQSVASSSSVARPAVPSASDRSPTPATSNATPFDASLSSVSGSSLTPLSVGASSAREAPRSVRKETEAPRRRSQQSQQQRPSVLLSQQNRYDDEAEDEDDDEDELPSPIGSRRTTPMPRRLSHQKLTVGVRRSRPQNSQLTHETTFDVDDSIDDHVPHRQGQLYDTAHAYEDENDDEDEQHEELGDQTDGNSSIDHRLPPRAERRPRVSLSSTASAIPRRKKPPVLSPSSLSSSYHHVAPATIASHTHPLLSSRPSSASSTLSPTRLTRRPSSATLLPPSSSSTRRLRGVATTAARRQQRQLPLRATGTSSAATVAASIQRLRRREGLLATTDDDDALSLHGHGDGDTREELDILMRVESALRHLEHENALAKEREAALAHQVSTLQDALRVRTAEKKHLETHIQQLARDKDQWRQAAQRAEHALAQLQDELAIAEEETQLQQSERHRLKHQNKELLSQVHRLHSIVYGRF